MRYYATTIRREDIFVPWVVSSLTFLLLLSLSIGQLFAAPRATDKVDKVRNADHERYGQLPLHFTPNKGQADAAVKYMARGNGYTIFLTASEAVLSMQGAEDAVVRMQLQGAHASPVVEAAAQLPGKINFLSGGREAWIQNLPTFGEVHYKEVYPGIDVVYYGTDRQKLEYDFVLQPNARPDAIRFRLAGAEAMKVDANGDLVLTVNGEEVRQLAPVSYQTIGGVQVPVASRYVVKDGEVSFELGKYDRSHVLVIDPVIEYSTYLGGAVADEARAITVDSNRNAYVTGCTKGSGFPAVQPSITPIGGLGDLDAFVTKVSADGTSLVWSTFVAGVKDECGEGIAVNSSGDVFITGWAQSKSTHNFPVTNSGALQSSHGGGNYDAFVAKLKNDGSAILWAGYIGGTSDDRGWDIAIRNNTQLFVVGEVGLGFSLLNSGAIQSSYGGGSSDGFLVKLIDGASPSLSYKTYLGGNTADVAMSVAVDASGAAHVTGHTGSSTTFPGATNSYNGGSSDAFYVKANAAGSSLLTSLYLGGSNVDEGHGIAVNGSAAAHIVGWTKSKSDFSQITTGVLHPTLPAGSDKDGFALKMSGTTVNYGTFLGGSGNDEARGVAVDAWDRAHVTGFTSGAITTQNPTQGASGGATDGFLYRLSNDGSSSSFTTYHGGAGNDFALDVAVDSDESSYLTGYSTAALPVGRFVAGIGFAAGQTPPAFDESFGGGSTDGWVTKYGVSADLKLSKSVMMGLYSPLVGQQLVYELKVTNLGSDSVSRFTISDDLPAGVVFISASGCNGPSTTLPSTGTRGLVTCDVQQSLSSGQSHTVSITVEVRAVTPIENCATVSNSTNDPSYSNNKSCTTITPQPQVNFWLPANQDAATATAFVSIPQGTGSFGTTFVGTDGGGVYRTTDMGGNWYPTNLVDVNVRGLARSNGSTETPAGNGAIYAATYGDGLFRTRDLALNGTNFDVINFLPIGGVPSNLLSVAINNSKPKNTGGDHDVWVGSDGSGVYYSKNDASSFTQFDNTSGLANLVIRAIAIGPKTAGSSKDRVFVGTHGRGVYYMDYNGSNEPSGNFIWAPGDITASSPKNASLDRAVVHALAVDGTGTSAVVYAGTNDGVYRGTWNGSKYLWEHVLSQGAASWEGAPIVRSLLLYHCHGEDYLMAGTDGQYVYRIDTDDLDDGPGYSWTRFTGLASSNNTMSGFQSATVLALHFTDWDEKLYAGTQDEGVHLSTDCGETFEQITNTSLQGAYRVIQAIVFDYDSPTRNRLFAGTFGFGTIMSDDLSNPQAPPILNWTSTNHGLTNPWIYSFALKENAYDPMNDYLFAGTWGGGVFRSTDDAETWQFSGLANRIVHDLAVNKNGVIFAATDRGEMARSTDNGLTWQETGVATTAIISIVFDPNNANVMYAGTFGAGVYKSTDGGFNWTQTNLKTGYIFDFTFCKNPENLSQTVLFAGTATGVKYSADGGLTWVDFAKTGLTTVDVRALACIDLDGNSSTTSDIELLAGTWGGGVFRYDPNSDAWIRDGMPGHAIALFAVHPVSGEVFVASDNGIYRKTFTSSSSVANESEWTEVPKGYNLGQNYPNPFNPATQIEFALPEVSQVRLTVFDALGRQVQTLVDGALSAGTHQVTFEARDLPSGVYFYRLQTPKQTLTQSMILMK